MSKNNIEEEYRKELIDHRKTLIKSSFEISDQFISRIFWFSAGAISLSLLIVENLKSIQNRCFLLVAWILLVLSMLFALFSYITSQNATQKELKIIDDILRDPEKILEDDNNYNKLTKNIEYLTIGLLFLGTIFLFLFIIKNL